MRIKREQGVALITTLMVLSLVAAIVVGMSWMVMSDQRLGGNYKNRDQAFYGAEAGMEKMTSDMGTTFGIQGSLTAANITTIMGTPPVIPGIQFVNALGASTYLISPLVPVTQNATILPPSPYAGMQGLITPFTMTVAAQTTTGAEVKLQRQIQAVAIPVFQFGIYSDSDLAFFNGPPFDFGGRVHTNGNLWLAANSGPLYLADKVTVAGQVIRTNLENGWPQNATIQAGNDYSGTVTVALTPNPAAEPAGPSYTNGQWRALGLGEGSTSGSSVYGNISPTANNPTWNGTVVPAYNGMIRNGVPTLSLTSTALGGITSPIALIRRPAVGEAAANPAQFAQRFYSQASLRIMLDDYPAGVLPGAAGACNAADMMSLDGIDTTTKPTDLATLASVAKSGAGGAYSTADGYWVTTGNATITGCIKIEYQNAGGTFHDVTTEILNLGYIGRNINPQAACSGHSCSNVVGPTLVPLHAVDTEINSQGPNVTGVATVGCADPSPNAVIRIERLRDNPKNATPGGGCGSATQSYDYWPMALYDTRESVPRPAINPGNITAEGVMYYIELDVTDLDKWFMGTIGANGTKATGAGGYAVYFTDRRGNLVDPKSGTKVGAFGFNDIINPANANSCPNNTLDQGEDLEGDGTLRTYGGVKLTIPNLLASMPNLVANASCAGTWPGMYYVSPVAQPSQGALEARENQPVFFRRALKIVNGATINLGTACYGAAPNPPCGLSIMAENPVYIQGDYNSPGGNLNGAGTVAASVDGDAVTLLSDNWNDVNSFISPYDYNGRTAVQTSYRVAIIAGKQIPFQQPAGEAEDFGTDGGLHNFLRYLENWGGISLNYEGSLVSFYYNRQGIGVYKTGGEVYNPPNRNYSFDTNFKLGPQWLPPRTPTLRSLNTTGFSQMLMPTQ